ncbi:hypothetical protein H9P43_007593 [Blastocladiella emersonii ATCC 22665]|nr:hypothetical protein H9P43_007593 [Blastocladiella emersonii ATCC 22665]
MKLIPELVISRPMVQFDGEAVHKLLGAKGFKLREYVNKAQSDPIEPEKAAHIARNAPIIAKNVQAHWDLLVSRFNGILKPSILRKLKDGVPVKNKFNGVFFTDGYTARVVGYKGGIWPKESKDRREEVLTKAKAKAKSKGAFKRINRRGDAMFKKVVSKAKHKPTSPLLSSLSSLPLRPPIPGCRNPLGVHVGQIPNPNGKVEVWMDPSKRDIYKALVLTPEHRAAHKRLVGLVNCAAALKDSDLMKQVGKVARGVMSVIVRCKALLWSCLTKKFHNDVGHHTMTKCRKLWAKEYGLHKVYAKLSQYAKDPIKFAKFLVETLDMQLAEAFNNRVARLRFFNELQERRWWAELTYSLRDTVVVISSAFQGFSVLSCKLSAPVKKLIHHLRAARIPTYIVSEHYSSKWCAACYVVGPKPRCKESDDSELKLTGKKKDKAWYQKRACPRCGVHVQRDQNAAVNIFGFTLDPNNLTDNGRGQAHAQAQAAAAADPAGPAVGTGSSAAHQ